ncbi:zinc finger MIZ domain-containing protein 1-like isoform X1 [Ylistrum balloti]|uniref:zinc finger MIZ domain-containing protein 1-like isoform X1 n=2 Tax=Ylistrum balloti TaxID=509963 RepID=UPI002905C975|nr:zinc finger MIZ domain-containing protein 1-like isoform X1 [Ylistrum balloti]
MLDHWSNVPNNNAVTDMERHIQQTVDRLHCIKNHLSTPAGFQNAARELLEWCSDMRAFQKAFEDSLIQCLTVVSQVSTQPGYDLDLGYRLLAVCAAHRDKLSSKAAAMLSVWCEELGRLLLLRHQKNRVPDSKGSGMHPQIQKAMPPVPSGDPNGQWLGNQGQPGQALSVVTTVWGTTQSTQSGPFQHNTPGYTNTTMSTTNYTQQPQGFNTQMQKGNYSNPQNIPFRRDSGGYQRPSGYPPTPNTPGTNTPNGPNDYPGGQAGNAALSAALVAAAATATATATATASMVMQEQQNQHNINMQMNMNGQYAPNMQQMPGQQSFNNQYPGMPQRPTGPMVQGPGPGPGPGPGGPMVHKYNVGSRRAPYPNPSQMMSQKRQQFPNGVQQYGGPQPYAVQQQYPQKPQYPAQQPLPSPTYGPQPGMRPNAPPHYVNGHNQYGPNQFPPQVRQMPPQGQPFNQYNNQGPQQNMQSSNMSYPHSPLPGNPTPPITPGAVQSPYPGPMGIKKDLDELRLTFPVRDGVVLPPFRLEHNLAVSNHVFHLRESVFQTLMWRSDLELQLKCFHHEDRQMNTNWPASVTVSVNANPLTIERGENKTSHKPLYLKGVCAPGRNTIQITVTACCCSHLFVLQLVHRPSVRSVLQGLLRKRLLPAEHCITKIKRNFSNVASGGGSLNGEDGVEQTAIKVSLKCPITFRRITLPARGHECKHIQCFDLESYLQLNCERGSWRCPVCNKTALLEGLEIDQYIWGILTNLSSTEFEEVTIDPMAAWKPVPHKSIKEEDGGGDACANARWTKAMSPTSMQLPTMNSWDSGGRQSSPFQMRPSSQGPVYPTMPGGEVMSGGPPQPGNYPHQGGPTDYPHSGPLSHMPSGHPTGDSSVMNNTNSNDMHSVDLKPPTLHNSGNYPSPVPVMSPSGDHRLHGEGPGTPTTPQTLNHSGGGGGAHPLSHPPQPNNSLTKTSTNGDTSAGDFNFDPAPILESEGDPTLDLQLDNLGDPIELLSYLGPPESSSSPAPNSGNRNNQSNSTTNATDDLLALFE